MYSFSPLSVHSLSLIGQQRFVPPLKVGWRVDHV
jgi:hypothetical protein